MRSLGLREIHCDAQLPPALARVLRENGCDAVAVREVGLRDANDSDIWLYALQEGAATITKDEDFADRCLFDQNQPVIVWLRIRNSSNQTLSRWLIPVWPEILHRIALGDRLIEVF
jgi:predicted nuclease of predicted toxin-antitoxin system